MLSEGSDSWILHFIWRKWTYTIIQVFWEAHTSLELCFFHLDKDYYIDGQNTQLFFFEKNSTGGGKKARHITPRGWIVWTIIFYNPIKIHIKIYLMRGQTLFWIH
jgi:hypothetical protein